MAPSVDLPIGFVSMATGLSGHVIRAWERRYQAVTPRRSHTGRRRYSQSDIERLTLLKHAIDKGHRISQVAGLDHATLRDLGGAVSVPPPRRKTGTTFLPRPDEAQAYVEACLQAIEALNGPELRRRLQDAAQAFGHRATIEAVMTAVMSRVGQRWSEGALRVVHEHLASSVFQTYLCRLLDTPCSPGSNRPRILIGTPAGQWCHLGALAAAVTARDHGWEPVVLGPNLPAEEMAAARSMLNPRMIALSITCRLDDAILHDEFHPSGPLFQDGCPLVVGGQAAERYRSLVEAGGGILCATSAQFCALLR
jgi:DNA-binding transcriptional MerR regulator